MEPGIHIELDMRTLLPKVREAMESGELQAVKALAEREAEVAAGGNGNRLGGGKCLYAGPCAVGVGIPPDLRPDLDKLGDSGVGTLMDKRIISVPREQKDDFYRLQRAHDNSVIAGHIDAAREGMQYFRNKVDELSAKYGV